MPILANFLKSIDAHNEARVAKLKTELQATKEHLTDTQSSHFQTLFSGGLTFQVKPAMPDIGILTPATTLPAEEGSDYTSAQSSISSRDPSLPTAVLPQAQAQAQAQKQEWEQAPPQYCMCRAVRTVEGLWCEWTVGLRGQPAIAALDSRWGNRWRAGRQNELQWYSLRLEIIKEIRRIAQARRISEEAAMYVVHMQQQQTGSSMDQFCKQLRASRKVRVAAQKSK